MGIEAPHTSGSLADELLRAKSRLFDAEQGVYFAPVRHHSPACALALREMLRELQPAAVLIEGPDDLDHLLPLLQHADTRAPVALLCQSRRQAAREPDDDGGADAPPEIRSAFYPFCDYSPEWIAARDGAALGAQVAFIDLPWRHKAWDAGRDEAGDGPAEAVRSLMEERHFAHSRYLGAMAARLGCVDHHELWDRLFELRGAQARRDWRAFFGDVFSWCAAARFDYEPQVLEGEGSLARERHMAAHVKRWRARVQGPLVVVTGGFHTPELLANWQAGEASPAATKAAAEDGAWLIRYSFDRLDALNGYASGMPSPGYYQRVWERLTGAAPEGVEVDPFTAVALDALSGFAARMREEDHGDAASTAGVQAAALQVVRLAALRGNAGPGRQDLLDAIRSCFIKTAIDEGTRGFTADLRRFLSGARIGDVPPSAGSPPLVEDARRRARAAGVRMDDSTPRAAHLDLYRKPAHRERSRFFHAMSYLDAGVAAWVSGPDFIAGSRLHLLFEEWRVAWSPLVEAKLIELATDGASVEGVCLAELQREERALAEDGRGRSAKAAVMLLQRACLIGLHQRLPQLLQMLAAHLDEDANLASVVECGHRLVTLWRAREPLGLQQHPQVRALLERVWPAALFLLPDMASCTAAAEADAVAQLLLLRELGHMLETAETGSPTIDLAPLHDQLARFASGVDVAPGVCGASAALLFLAGRWGEAELADVLSQRFGPGADSQTSVRFLNGLMAAAPELLLRLPTLLGHFDRLVRGWDADAFIAQLPDLRHMFTRMKPQETADLATEVGRLHGAAEGAVELAAMNYETSEQDLLSGLRLEQALAATLERDGLTEWRSH
ncbi:DUF5682 family protein [Roseateles sp.]|uniref:DUF5682 family protein n=1 Tax=Roseateles sp. TaxID=1971397 RepID=UPI0032665F8C